MSSFSIHQFSSGIRNPQQNREGKWVSGGYDKEIAKESYNVPQEIKDAVNTSSKGGWRGFGIQNYPPQTGECALIARELENYCVLAVANQQQDDGKRPFIAYRYFWLDKQEFQNERDFSDFDGIATLLYHWQKEGRLQYNIRDWANSPELYNTSWDKPIEPEKKTRFLQQNSTRIQPLILKINSDNQSLHYNEPLIYEANDIGFSLEPEEVHCLAIKYSYVNNCSINWAWNVRRLENMQEGLQVIYCADAEALNWFNQQLIKHSSVTRPNESGREPVKVSGAHDDLARQAQETRDVKNVLLKFRGNFKKEDVLKLMDSYQEHEQGIVKFQSQNAIDSFLNEMPKPRGHNIKYATLLTALAPQEKRGILLKLMKLKNNPKKNVAIDFLDKQLMVATQNSDCFNRQICGLFCKNFTYTRWVILNSQVTTDANDKDLNWWQKLIQTIHIPDQSGEEEAIVSGSASANQAETTIQDFLIKLCSNLREEDVLKLMDYYQQYQQGIAHFSEDQKKINSYFDEMFADKNTIDSFEYEMPEPKAQNIKYATLLTALAPDENKDILSELMKLNNKLKNEVAINFLDRLLKMATLSQNCLNHPISELFYKNFTFTRFRLMGSLNNYILFVCKGVALSLIPFFLFVIWMYLQPNISITISTRRNGYKNLASFEIPPTSIGKEGSLAELLNEYNSKYKAIKILEPNKKNNTNIKKISNTLYEELGRDKQKIVNKLTDMEVEQYIQQLQDSDPNQVIDARQKEIYTNLEQFTPKIITEKLPVLKPGAKDKVNVTILQDALDRNGNYTTGQENYEPGEFDKFTKKAVENLQSNQPIEQKGKVGASTWSLLVGRLKDLQVEKVYETLNKHLELDNQTDYNIVTEIKKCQDDNQNEKALEFVNCLEKLND